MQFLGKFLPAAVFGLLVIYSLKDVSVFSGSRGIPEMISILLVIVLHMCKRQMLLCHRGRDGVLYAAGAARILGANCSCFRDVPAF